METLSNKLLLAEKPHERAVAAAAPEPIRCDVLLFVATTSERDALEAAAAEMGFKFQRVPGKYFRYYDLGQIGDSKVLAVKTNMGPFSFDGSASKAIHAKIETGATSLICLGMAFGVDRERQTFGDVLISRMLLPYDHREVLTDDQGGMRIVYEKDVPHEARVSVIRLLEKQAEQPDWTGRVSFGALLTGGSKIRCTQYRNELVGLLSIFGEPVIGGEMEGSGLLATCDRRDPSWVVLKGISDFADEHRNEDVEAHRETACRNAARFVLQALRDYNPNARQ